MVLTVYCSLLTGSLISAYNFWHNPQYAEDDLRGAVKQIAQNWRPGDAVLINAGYTYRNNSTNNKNGSEFTGNVFSLSASLRY